MAGKHQLGDDVHPNEIEPQGAGSGLDADLLDGSHASEIGGGDREFDYVLITDGASIDAYGRGSNPDKTGQSDIGPLLEDIIVNELPPSGSRKEGSGAIFLTRGDYPGDLSNATGGTGAAGVVGSIGCHIYGQGRNHIDDSTTNSNLPETVPGVKLNYSDKGFVAPNVDTDLAPYFKVENIQLHGPGETAVTGATAFYNRGQSNPWDKIAIKDCVIQQSDVSFDFTDAHDVKVINTHPVFCKKLFTSDDKFWAEHCHFYSNTSGSFVRTGSGTYSYQRFTDCIFGLSPGTGTANLEVRGGPMNLAVMGCRFQNLNTIAGDGINTDSSVTRPAQIHIGGGTTFQDGDTWDAAVRLAGESIKAKVDINDESGSTDSVVLDGSATNPVNSTVVETGRLSNGISQVNGPIRPRINGSVLLGAAPSGANYGVQDQGTEIYDTSVSPPDHYIVDSSGSVLGPL